MDSGKSDDAIKAFEKAVKLDDKSSTNHLLLAQALGTAAQKVNVIKQGMMAPRIKREMERARDLDPRSVDAHQGLMQFYMEAPGIMGGSMAKARAEAAGIAKLNRLRGHFANADIARHEKDSTAMEREYRAAAAEDPDSVAAYATLALFLVNTKRPADAFATLDKVLAQRPNEPMALYYIGRVATVSGEQIDRGEASFRKYLALPPDPNDKNRVAPANAHFRLGELLAKKGSTADAKREFEAALQLNPRLEAAKTALKKLPQ